ncbi:hypothetical protein OG196_14080 [Kitasatospora purpeofusca]|uniref:hypothetical protein n=1 Tax=Kitasatospora purpeofusca TaxID=67352 RepID=UPI002E0F8803|nr:hypothetical protein OG196_14080 [Kitasatospora purpeofusca]
MAHPAGLSADRVIIRIDLRVDLQADAWAEVAGSDPFDAARDACWYLSDALESLPHLGEDGCPAYLRAVPGWSEEQDLLGNVEITARWHLECPAVDWTGWRADPGGWLDAHDVPRGTARDDLTVTVVEGLVSMSMLAEARAVMTLTHPWQQTYDHQWRVSARASRPAPPRRTRRRRKPGPSF